MFQTSKIQSHLDKMEINHNQHSIQTTLLFCVYITVNREETYQDTVLRNHVFSFLFLLAFCVIREWCYPGACLPAPTSHGYLLQYCQSLYWTQVGFGHAPVWDSRSWEARPAAQTWCVAGVCAWTGSLALMTGQKSSYAEPCAMMRSSWPGPGGQTAVKKGAQHSPR